MAQEEMEFIVKNLYPYFWHKFQFPVEYDTESECIDLVKNLRKAVWAHRIVSFWHWYPFLEKNLIPIISSPETYVNNVIFMVSTTIRNLPNRHESFVTTCSLVTAVAAYVYEQGYLEFLDYSPIILMVLFESFYVEKSGTYQILDHLQEHITRNNYLEAYDMVEEETKGDPFADVIYHKGFVKEIQFKIKSKISVSKHAEVYCQTQEVMKRFRSRPSVKVVSKRSMSSQIKQWEDREDLSSKMISEKDIENINLKLVSLCRSGRRLLQEANKSVLLDSKNQTSRIKNTKAIASQQTELYEMEQPFLEDLMKPGLTESQKSIYARDMNMDQVPLEKQSFQETKKPGVLDIGDFTSEVKNIEVIVSQRSDSFQTEPSFQEVIKKIRVLESPRKMFVEDIDDIHLKQVPSIRPEKQSLQQMKIPEIFCNEDSGSGGKNIDVIFSKRNASFQTQQSLHKDTERPNVSESLQSDSAEGIDMNLKQFPLFQPEKSSQQTESPGIFDTEDGMSEMKNTEVIASKWRVPFLTELSFQEDKKSSIILDSQPSIFSEGINTINSDVPSSESEKLPLLDMRSQEVSEVEGTINRMDNTEIISTTEKALSVHISPSQLTEQVLPNPEESKAMKNDEIISEKKTESIDAMPIYSFSENRLFGDKKEFEKSEIEQCSIKLNVMSSEIEMLEDLETPRMLENKQRNSEKDQEAGDDHDDDSDDNDDDDDDDDDHAYDDHDETIPACTEKQIQESIDETRISNEEKGYMTEDTESVSLKWNLSQGEQVFQEDCCTLSGIENVASISVPLTSGEMERNSSFQSKESTPLVDLQEFTESNNDQSGHVTLSSTNFPSDDNTCEFRTGNKIDENNSDATQHEVVDSSRNSASQPTQKKWKKKLKSKQPNVTEDTSLFIPSKNEVVIALLFLLQKLLNSVDSIYNLLGISRKI